MMNYLGHYAYNHEVRGLAADPYFVLGAALPDLWTRFSRKRRLRWKAVRAADPDEPRVARLRAGLLNHVEADQRFHALPVFERWRRELKRLAAGEAAEGYLVDFLAHLIPELMLDHHVVCRAPALAEAFYDGIGACDYEFVEAETSRLGEVDASGLAREIDGFVRRRFLPRFSRLETIVEVVEFVLGLTAIVERPSRSLIERLTRAAREMVDPDEVWEQMGKCEARAREAAGGARVFSF